MTDLCTYNPFSRHVADGFFLTEQQVDWYRRHCLGAHSLHAPRVSPLLAADLAGLPPE